MAKASPSGTRIRNFRTDKGMRQSDLAKACDISPSYLNLIEHNRRRVGGGLMNKIAAALEIEPVLLSGEADAALAAVLEAASEAHPATGAEKAQTDDLIFRFPGWARLIEAQHGEARRLAQVVERLGDRLTHDPFLSASMHSVLSSVTAIRSASAILAQGGDVEPEWEARFHRNIFEDSQRLTEATETLVRYLDSDTVQDQAAALPQDEVDAWIASLGWRVDALEQDPGADLDRILSEAAHFSSNAGLEMARSYLARYREDVLALPEDKLADELAESGDPIQLATGFSVGLAVLFRRLAARREDAGPGFGLVACDSSGTIVFRKPLPDFQLPRYGAACPLWPLYETLQRPMVPQTQAVVMPDRDGTRFQSWAFAELYHPAGLSGPALVQAWMLFRPDAGTGDMAARDIGTSCRICPRSACVARREPSVFQQATSGSFDSSAIPRQN